MKKLLLLSILALLGITQMVAQEYEYVPFVREGVKWVYSYTNVDPIDGGPSVSYLQYGTVYLTLELKGDTVINGKTYKAMHKYYGDAINTVNDTIPVYLREEDKVVYGIVPDGITYGDCPIGCYYDYTIDYKLKNGEEFVLYDFHDPQSYWSNLLDLDSGFFQDFVLNYTENMQVGNHWPKVYTFEGFKMIEGIGIDGYDSSYSGYTLFPFWPIIVGKGAVWFQFRYLVEDGEIVYKGIHFEGEKPTQNNYEYVPFVREGVKWVYTYENYSDSVLGWTADPNLAYGKVYLTLELKGDTVINGKTYKAMHKYYGDAINTVNDTIPVYLREQDKVVYGIVPDGKTYPDCPIGNIYDYTLLNNMEKGEEFVLYNFKDPQAYWRGLFSPEISDADFEEIFDDFVLQSTSLMNIGSHVVKCHTFGTYSTGFRMIEGIGVDGKSSVWFGYTLFPWTPIYVGVGHVHFKIRYVTEGDEIIYKSVNYEGPKPDQDDYEYVPFVREGVKWVYTYENYGGLSRPADPDLQYGTVYLTLELKGDTVINGKSYKAMHKYYGDAINTVNDTIPVYLREEDKVVYGIVPDGKVYKDCPIGSYLWNMIWNKVTNGEEFELYNFQDPQAYWLNLFGPDSEMFEDFKLQSTSFISIGSHLVKCHNLRHYRMIEGIGVDGLPNAYQWHGYTLFPWRDIYVGINATAGIDVDFRIRYVTEGNEIIYKSVNYENPHDAIDEVVADRTRRPIDPHYYNLMGQPMGTTVPSTPGIYIHQGKKIVVR